MLPLILAVTIILLLLSIVMHFLSKSENQRGLSRAWLVPSSVFAITIVGIVYLMMTEEPILEAVDHGPQGPSAITVPQTETDQNNTPVDSNQSNAQSYDYLLHVLEALKKGEAIPEQYLNLLPLEDQNKVKQLETR